MRIRLTLQRIRFANTIESYSQAVRASTRDYPEQRQEWEFYGAMKMAIHVGNLSKKGVGEVSFGLSAYDREASSSKHAETELCQPEAPAMGATWAIVLFPLDHSSSPMFHSYPFPWCLFLLPVENANMHTGELQTPHNVTQHLDSPSYTALSLLSYGYTLHGDKANPLIES